MDIFYCMLLLNTCSLTAHLCALPQQSCLCVLVAGSVRMQAATTESQMQGVGTPG